MESLLIAHDKAILNKADSSLPLEIFQCNIIGYHMVFYILYDAHLFHCAYTILVCSIYLIFIIMKRLLYFIKKQNVRAFIITLVVTMKVVAFESYPEINGFVEKLVIFSVIKK